MTPTTYRAALARLGLNVTAAQRLFAVDARTAQRWAASGTVPHSVEMALSLLAGDDPAPYLAAAGPVRRPGRPRVPTEPA